MSNNIAKEVTIELFHLLDASMDKIRHCLGQLDENQIWWRSFEGQNSIGNHILHMGGNLRQWVCSGIGGGPDNRNREQEFAERGPITTDQLLRQLDQVIADAKTTLSSCTDTDLLRQEQIQDFDVSVLGAAMHSITHFVGHTHQIIAMSRSILKDEYQFAWTPDSDRSRVPI